MKIAGGSFSSILSESRRPFGSGRRTALAASALLVLFAAVSFAADLWPLRTSPADFSAPFFSNTRALAMRIDLTPAMAFFPGGSQGLPFHSLPYAALVKLTYRLIPFRCLCLRAVSVGSSLVMLMLLYRLAARLFCRPVALLFLFLLVTSPKYVEMFRSFGIVPISQAFLVAGASALVWSWDGRWAAGKVFLLALLGYVLLTAYVVARLFIFLPVGYFCLRLRSDWRKLILYLLFLTAIVLAVQRMFPAARFNLIDSILIHSEWLRWDREFVGNDTSAGLAIKRLKNNANHLIRYLGIYRRPFRGPEGEWGMPDSLLDPLLAPFFLLGLAACLGERSRRSAFVLLWQGIFLLVPLLADSIPPRRIIYAFTPAYLLAAAGLWIVFRVVGLLLPGPRPRKWLAAAAIVFLASLGSWGLLRFFFRETKPGYPYSRRQLEELAVALCRESGPMRVVRYNRASEQLIWGNPYVDPRFVDLGFAEKLECDVSMFGSREKGIEFGGGEIRPAKIKEQAEFARREGGGVLYVHAFPPGNPRAAEYEDWPVADLRDIQDGLVPGVSLSLLAGLPEVWVMRVAGEGRTTNQGAVRERP